MIDWEEIEKSHRTTVWGVVYRILAHRDDALDCCQEIFLEAIKQRSSGDVKNWGAYLRWLATRRAIDFLRSRRRRPTQPIANEEPATNSDPSAHMDFLETVELVRRELAQLPEAQATAFWLANVEGWTYQQIAEQSQTTPNAVGMLIHRAREQLKQQLRRLEPRLNHQP